MAGPAAVTASEGPAAHLLYQGKWWNHSGILALNLLLVFILLTSSTNGFDGSMMNGLQAVPHWVSFFGKPQGATLGLYNAIQNIGSLAAIPFAPYVADHFGRRTGIILGCLCMFLATGLQAGAQNNAMFIAGRGLVGFGVSFAHLASALLIVELAYPSQRAKLSSLYNTMWFTGSIIAAATTLGTFRIDGAASWRIPSAMMGLVPVLQMIIIWFLPESPRWLIAHGREEEAVRVLAKYHAINRGDLNDELVQFEREEIKEALRLEAEAAKSTSYLSLLRTPGNRRRLRIVVAIAFFSQWSGNGIASYYLDIVLGKLESVLRTRLRFSTSTWEWPFTPVIIIATTASLFVEKIGRRKLFLTSNAGMLFAYVLWTTGAGVNANNTSNRNAANLVMASIFIFNGFYAIAYTPLLVSYTVEITPFQIRAKMFAIMNVSVTASSFSTSKYVNPVAQDAIKWKYYIVYVVWLCFELGFIWMYLVETKGRSLEETAALFDGEDALKELENRAAHDLAAPGTPSDEKFDGKV
ncbi:Sugar (and other) transporter [Rhizoctonia solani]|uniref:Sugar (And other) transporter n=1 Tax=Rhizoctonia solani TaxID=456999 RepID=A0A8H8P2M6_9AGAM|nr:Sugar (and other) transporter [Rhizoctonia solani]QRW22703.1 Sugar (and other) transporter [Rhizoctonia solani]